MLTWQAAGLWWSWDWYLPTGRQNWVLGSLAVGPGGPKAGVHWLVGRAVARGVLGLLLAHWWLRLGLGLGPAHWYLLQFPE